MTLLFAAGGDSRSATQYGTLAEVDDMVTVAVILWRVITANDGKFAKAWMLVEIAMMMLAMPRSCQVAATVDDYITPGCNR